MDAMTMADAKTGFDTLMDRAIRDHRETVVTRENGEAVVVLSLEDWNSIQETLHLLSNPENARRLRDAVADLDAGSGVERALIE